MLASWLAAAAPAPAGTNGWQTLKAEHFIVLHAGDDAFAEAVARKAESYYASIAADLGYTRYHNFWRWDNRVKILLYATATDFTAATQAPAWATGRASHTRHEIASFQQSGDAFLTTVLPHEIAHLIMADFIGADRLPLWLTEGFAQWEQERRGTGSFAATGTGWLPLDDLMALDIRKQQDPALVGLFYRQSASVVGFMIEAGGGERFGLFCRALRDGKPRDEALAKAYADLFPDTVALQREWLRRRPAR